MSHLVRPDRPTEPGRRLPCLLGLLATLAAAVSPSLPNGPVEFVDLAQAMRFEYFDSFTIVGMQSRLCQASLLAVRQASYELTLVTADNLKFMMITTQQIASCREFNWIGCPKQAAYCKFVSADQAREYIRNSSALVDDTPCVEELFIYLFPESRSEPAQAIVYARPSASECVPSKPDYCLA